MTSFTQTVARTAAVVAMVALALTSVAPLAQAQTTTVTTTTTTAAVSPFVRDLTLGSTGADVTALQTWLIARGFSIPAGATGYFGTQTRAALSAYQAANGITPTAGYFGPITRTKINALLITTPTTPTNPGSGNNGLRGNEADIRDFELTREELSGNEGETEIEVATATFEVEDGDIRVERLEVYLEAVNGSLNDQPWRYLDRVIIFADGDEIADMDVDSRNDWDERGDTYRLNITGLDYVVREGDEAEITIAFDIASSIDSADLDQEFDVYIPDRGIRAVDAEGIQQYTGDDGETVTFGFGEEESGDLRITTNSDDPDATTLIVDEDRESDDYSVFIFDIENSDDVDTLIMDLMIDVTSDQDVDDVIRRATLEVGGDDFDGDITATGIEFEDMDFELSGDDEETFELIITLVRNAPDTTLRFTLDSVDVEAEGVRSGDDATVRGSASSETHTVATTGIMVTDGDTSASSNSDANLGTFSISFDVEALEDDVYIYRGAGAGDNDTTPFSELASTTGIAFTVYQGGTASTTVGGTSAIIQSGARVVDNHYEVREGDTETFTLTVTLDPQTSGTDLYYIELDAIRFDSETLSGTIDDSVYIIPKSRDFQTNVIAITGA